MLDNLVYLIIFCLINNYWNYLRLDYFIKKLLSNTPKPRAKISSDDVKHYLRDPQHGFKTIKQKLYRCEDMVTHEIKTFPNYETIAREFGWDKKNTTSGVNNNIKGRANQYKGYKWSIITRETYFKEE